MFLLQLLFVLVLFGTSFAFPQTDSIPINKYFIYPNERKNAPTGRIIGGQEAEPHQFPYLVALYGNFAYGTAFCGGSLVSRNYVLTAAHCVEGAISVDLIFGAQVIDQPENSQLRLSSQEFIIHPGWDRSQLINDIAFIKLTNPIQENDYIKIIRIANGIESYAGTLGVISGWGRTTNNQEGVTSILRYVIGDILSNDDCRNIEPYASVIKPTHLCLSGLVGNVNIGTCNGDSGGPLAVDGVQVGLVSFGYNDCEAGKPSVFTRLTEFLGWVRENSDVDV